MSLIRYIIISDFNDSDTLSQSNNLKHSIMQGKFIILLFILSKYIQFKNAATDLREAVGLAMNTLIELKNIRTNINNFFKNIFEKGSALTHHLY